MENYIIGFTSEEIREISNALLSKRLQISRMIEENNTELTKAGLIAMGNKISHLELKILNATA